ncbi:chromogranin-A isoform X2 [Pyxicephalus adspersus]|uniref:Chromogranin-A n=1 Tax=Pyxicephalus adspersus TaxID=30357 RepID=A0AAV2ZLT5_PYXAD|nr:TPA: hypothetical protein GDO54_005606 [Pyxicephalus adspersus]
MFSLGLLSLIVCTTQVLSLPVSSLESEGDTKVMKCIVEVISDTLSKPEPIPITPDCLETLREDERIISILRHQNLLKELQDLAAQGAMERIQKAKKNRGYEEELSAVLEKDDKGPGSEKSEEFPLHSKLSESEEVKRQPDEERKESSERSQEGDSTEELESNEISKREETPEDEEEIDNRITDEINDMELPKDNQEDTSDGASEEKEAKKDPEDEEIGDHDKEDPKQESNETENEEDDTQREDNSMRTPEDSRSDAESSKESKQSESETDDCSDDENAKDLEDSKRWNKMDELAKELRAKRCAKRDTSEEDPDRSMKIPTKDQKFEPANEEQEDKREQQTSREPQISKRPEDKKEEEGSANRRTEDQELESLAAIEAELESVAHKLHDLRRG